MCCPPNKGIKRITKTFLALGGLHEDKLCDMIEFRCVVTVSTLAEWLARENIKRLISRPCINVEHSHGVVYMENTT